jgi:hypothetical protein
MPTLKFTDEQILTLRAVWQYFLEDSDGMENIADALELEENDTDGAEARVDEVTKIVMKD